MTIFSSRLERYKFIHNASSDGETKAARAGADTIQTNVSPERATNSFILPVQTVKQKLPSAAQTLFKRMSVLSVGEVGIGSSD